MNKIVINGTMNQAVALLCDKIRTELTNSNNSLCVISKDTETKTTFINILLVTLSKFNIFGNSMHNTVTVL